MQLDIRAGCSPLAEKRAHGRVHGVVVVVVVVVVVRC